MKPRIAKSQKCGKYVYSSQRLLDKLIDKIREETPERAENLRHYYCPSCDGYHLTKNDATKTLTQGLKYYDEWLKLLKE